MRVRMSTAILVLASAAIAAPVVAQSVQFDLGLGYQWLDVSGNKDVYRTQSGEQEGALLDSLNLVLTNTQGKAFYDQIRVTAGGIGTSPDSRFRLDVGLRKAYNLRLNVTRAKVFSYLPGFANPLLASGVVPGQHTIDRRRDTLDLDLEILPGRMFTPLVGYSRYAYSGPGTTTYHFGEDEFLLRSKLDEKVNEYRVGVAIAAGSFRGSVVQGWRSIDSNTSMSLSTRESAGNNTRPVLGHDVFANTGGLNLHSTSSSEMPFTNAYVTGQLFNRLRLVASYVRTEADLESDDTGTMSGQFVSFALQRFFTGANELGRGRAENPTWRAEGRLELELLQGLDFLVGYRSSHRGLDGRTLVTTNYLDTVNFSNANPADITKVLAARTAWERDEDVAEGKLVFSAVSWLRVWGAAARVGQDVSILPDIAEIVVPGGQGGSFRREIDRVSAGADADFGVVSLGGDWSKDEADQAVVRTDYLDRKKLRGRIAFKLGSVARLVGTAEKIESSNPQAGIRYDGEVKHWAADLELTPVETIAIRVGYDTYQSDSSLIVRRPQDLGFEPSIYAEDGKNVEGSISAKLGHFTIDVGGNRYSNEGDLAFDLDRTYARFDIGLSDAFGIYGSFERRKYDEKALALANFEGDRYGIFLRWAGK